MEKPITVKRAEFAQMLVDITNDSGLPFFVVEMMLKEFIGDVHNTAVRQYQMDKEDYENHLAAEETKQNADETSVN